MMVITMAGNSRLRNLLGAPFQGRSWRSGILRTEGRKEEALRMLAAAFESGSAITIPHQHMPGVNDISGSSGRSTPNG